MWLKFFLPLRGINCKTRRFLRIRHLLIKLIFKYLLSGANHKDLQLSHIPVTAFFTDRFSLNLSRIQIPTGTSVTNCNNKQGIMSTCRHVHVRLHCFILTEACSCRLVCKNAVALAYYGSCMLLVGSWFYSNRDHMARLRTGASSLRAVTFLFFALPKYPSAWFYELYILYLLQSS